MTDDEKMIQKYAHILKKYCQINSNNNCKCPFKHSIFCGLLVDDETTITHEKEEATCSCFYVDPEDKESIMMQKYLQMIRNYCQKPDDTSDCDKFCIFNDTICLIRGCPCDWDI